MRRLPIWSVLAIAILFVSCTMPSSRESFCRRPLSDGSYRFTMEFADSAASYDLYLCTCFDCRDEQMVSTGTLPLEIRAVSPDGHVYGEKVYFPLNEPIRATYNTKEYICLYRSGLSGSGIWQLSLTPTEPWRLSKGCRGFGIQMRVSNGER